MKMLREVVTLVFLLQILNAAVVEFSVKTLPCPKTEVACLCASPPNGVIKKFEVKYDLLNFKYIQNCSEFYDKTCKLNSCLYHPVKKTNGTEIFSERSASIVQEAKYPRTVVIPPLDDADDFQQTKTRFRRFPTSCNNSIRPIRHTKLTCTFWPKFVTCDVVCAHGYVMEEKGKIVSKTVRKCRESEMHWYPEPFFPVCKPYMYCRVVLISPGKSKCKISGPDVTSCIITCKAYEGHDATPVKQYHCMDKDFEKTLPHCATVDKKIDLVNLPPNFRPEV